MAATPTVTIVTGNSNSGSSCLHELLVRYKGKTKVRAAFRNHEKAVPFVQRHQNREDFTSLVGVDANNKESLDSAFKGAQFALIVTPHGGHDMSKDAELTSNMINSAVDMGVQYIVYVGSWTVLRPVAVPILASRFLSSEELLKKLERERDLKWTSLRPGFFNQNFISLFSNSIKEKSSIYFPEVFIPPVDPRDIGRVAAALFARRGEGHHGKCYDISGPRLYSMSEFASSFSECLEKDIQYVPIPSTQLKSSFPPFLFQLFEYMASAGKEAVPFSTITKELTGWHTTFEEWLTENKHCFM